jgi:hypothetical protein
MSTRFFIAPYKPTEWEEASSDLRIDPQEYREKLLERWPDAETYLTLAGPYSLLEWQLFQRDEFGLSGALMKDRMTVSFDAHLEFIKYILWYRAFVPASYQLFLFNSSSLESFELKSSVTGQELEGFTGVKA